MSYGMNGPPAGDANPLYSARAPPPPSPRPQQAAPYESDYDNVAARADASVRRPPQNAPGRVQPQQSPKPIVSRQLAHQPPQMQRPIQNDQQAGAGNDTNSSDTLELALHRLAAALEKNTPDLSKVANSGKNQQLIAAISMAANNLNQGAELGATDAVCDQGALKADGSPFLQLTDKNLKMLNTIFNQCDTEGDGDLNQTEVIRLLRKIGYGSLETDDLIKIIQKMDADNGGTISVEEFMDGIDNLMAEFPDDAARLRDFWANNTIKVGFAGTTWRPFENTIWMMNSGIMIMTVACITVGVVYFSFILIPLTMAYLLTFLLGPLYDVFYQRPLLCMGCQVCYEPLKDHVIEVPGTRDMVGQKEDSEDICCKVGDHGYLYDEDKKDYRGLPCGASYCGCFQRGCMELIFLGRLPAALALLVCLLVAGGICFGVAFQIADQFTAITDDKLFMGKLYDVRDEIREVLAVDYEMVITDLEPVCVNTKPGECMIRTVTPKVEAPDGTTAIRMSATYIEYEASLGSKENLTEVRVLTMSDLTGNYGGLILFFSDFTLTLLLCIYMLSTRIPRTVKDAEIEEEDPHHMTLFMKVESSIRNYIILKTKLSLLTGFLVGAVLGLARVKLWFVFGVLTFVLNFIPNFGSLIAMFLPVPILIVDACGEGKTEDCLEPVQQALAFIVPAIIQGIIGNAVEPSLFGKSLNLTAISVLASLVLWGSIWGIQGAILSVPLLGVTKLLLDAADYPLAKQALNLIREDNAIEEALEMAGSNKGKKKPGGDDPPAHQHHHHHTGHHLYAGTYQQQLGHHERQQQNIFEQESPNYPHLPHGAANGMQPADSYHAPQQQQMRGNADVTM